MSKIFVNRSIAKGESCRLKNGATKRLLLIVNKTGFDITEGKPFEGTIGTLEKGNTSFIFINASHKKDSRTLFVYANGGYGVIYHKKEPIFSAVSTGGYGNSESTIAIVENETLIEESSYKNRSESDFVLTNSSEGFISIAVDEAMLMIHSQDITEA